jgi:hypothetical protein
MKRMSGVTKNQEVTPCPFPEPLCWPQPSTANEERQRLKYSYGRRGRPVGGPPPLPSCPADLADLLDPPPGSQNRRLKFVGRKGRPDKLAQQWRQHAIWIEVEDALIVERGKRTYAVETVAKKRGLSSRTVFRDLKANKVRKNENRGEACPGALQGPQASEEG